MKDTQNCSLFLDVLAVQAMFCAAFTSALLHLLGHLLVFLFYRVH